MESLDQKKRTSSWLLQTVLLDINKYATKLNSKTKSPKRIFPAFIGNVMDGDKVTDQRFVRELAKRGHILITGETGTGKDFLVRVILEEILLYNEREGS